MGALLRLRPMWVPASLAIDRPIHARLIGESTMQQDRQRLMTAEHAGAWVTAVPSRIDGSDCIMSPAVFRTAVRYRLGVAVAHEGVVCSFCKQSFDIYGHHAGCCKKNADIIIRHNRIRNLVSRIGQEGLLSPVLEKRGILGDSKKPGRRPGDITFPCWQDSKGLAVDVCVTSPFSGRNLHSSSPAEDYGHRKHRKYDGGFVHTAYRFCALALETTGGVSEEALSFLQQLWRFAARQQGAKLCVYAGRAWARMSCNLQVSVAQAILHRVSTGGLPPPAERGLGILSVIGLETQAPSGHSVPSALSSFSPVRHVLT